MVIWQTVSAGNIYRLTLTVDEAFLTDSETVYPVEIDPELKVSDNTHAAGAIEDVGKCLQSRFRVMCMKTDIGLGGCAL